MALKPVVRFSLQPLAFSLGFSGPRLHERNRIHEEPKHSTGANEQVADDRWQVFHPSLATRRSTRICPSPIDSCRTRRWQKQQKPKNENETNRRNMKRNNLLKYGLTVLAASTALLGAGGTAQAADKKPNILFIMGDDIGWMQPSCYHQGLMVGETPNIDRIAAEGGRFMTYYAESSCTAGRTAF